MIESLRRAALTFSSAVAALASLCFAPMHAWGQSTGNGPAASATVAASPTAGRVSGINGEVRNMVLKGDSIEVTYKNTGELPTFIIGELQVHLSEDEVVSSVVFADELIVKPGATQRFRIAIPKLAKRKYTLVAIVDYGGEQMTAAMATLDMR